MDPEIHIWALPPGETDRLHEQVISTNCRNAADVEKVKAAAGADGWHGFRVVNWDGSPPDFAKAARA